MPGPMRTMSMRIRFRTDISGTGGYFEDLPKLMFILFAIALFVTSTTSVYGAYNRHNENTIMTDRLDNFCSEIMEWSRIAPERNGVFKYSRLESTSRVEWLAEFNPPEKRFEYQVQFLDRSLYMETTGFRADSGPLGSQPRPAGTDVYARTVPILIVDEEGNYRAGQMIVSIWRAEP